MIPKWKKWLSYLKEVHIESAPSEINPHLYVCMQKGKLQLCSENAIYSFDENYYNFSGAFEKMNLSNLNNQQMLILGFGLGSIPLILQNTFSIHPLYTGIELDEEVLYLFEKYNSEKIKGNLQLINTDAEIFVATCQQQFKFICSDIFLDNQTPEAFWHSEYLEQISSILEPEGALLINTLALTKENQKEADAFFEDKFQKIFPKAVKLSVHRNYMLLSNKDWLRQ